MKRLFIDEIENMRDLGGYLTKDGKVIKYDHFIRSNLPKFLSEKNIKEILSKGITTVIDLRSKEEVSKSPGIFSSNNEFNYYNVIIKGDGRLPDRPESVLNSYIEMLEGKEEIGKIFSIISEVSGGVIYYCSAGKDRTGLISALILKLLGVDNKDIAVDYIASGVYLKETLNEFASKVQVENIKDIIIPKEETMFKILEYIEKNYNTIENYLNICGVTYENLESIKAKAFSR